MYDFSDTLPVSVFVHSCATSFLTTSLYTVCVNPLTPHRWPPPVFSSLSHPLCHCQTVACVVDGASWNLPPSLLGLNTKTSFQSQSQNYLLIVTQQPTPWCNLQKMGDIMKLWHISEVSLFSQAAVVSVVTFTPVTKLFELRAFFRLVHLLPSQMTQQ